MSKRIVSRHSRMTGGRPLSLSPDKASELRSILSDSEQCQAMARHFVERSCEEMFKEGSAIGRTVRAIMLREYERNISLIFQSSESPIETIFLNSLMFSCMKNGILLHVTTPPPGDFRKATADRIQHATQLFKCYSFYKELPSEARPESFRRFLEMTGVEAGALSVDDARHMEIEAISLFDAAFAHALQLTLQPTFEGLNGGKDARADAVVWHYTDESVRIVVECDGFETHGEKEAFSSDRKRDRMFQDIGYSVRRYSGQEIHRQPIDSSMDLLCHLIDNKKALFEGASA